MKPLLRVVLDVPPSVNARTIITRHGGTTHPKVTVYQWQAKVQLRDATQDREHITRVRMSGAMLTVLMVCSLTERDYRRRDIDNMLQVPINCLKKHLEIDDARIDYLQIRKQLALSGTTPNLLIEVAESVEEELS